ncbi:MAG: class I SAM-dependent methyltransferase [Sphingosinicella sp.]
MNEASRQIARNIAIHDRIARKYEKVHGEIFNEIEQTRLRALLERARDAITSNSQPLRALDFGCGSGNLTRHLLALGFEVTAADISPACLDLVSHRHGSGKLDTLLMNGRDLAGLEDASFDLVATYSVLHHIPDYLGAVAELARVCKPGGAVVIDHEATEESWRPDAIYAEFRKAALKFDWRKYLSAGNYVHRLRRLFDPRHSNEGDIHVWPDDHIEWQRIKALFAERGYETVIEQDYLLYRQIYRREVFDRFVDRCTDTKATVFRRPTS